MAAASARRAMPPPPPVLLDHRQHPYRSLVVVFAVWKACLLGLAVVARLAGPAYDTSADLLLARDGAALNSSRRLAEGRGVDVGHAIPVGGLVSRLASWDAVYFVEAARRGYRYEQEYAFGAGLPAVVSLLRRLPVFGVPGAPDAADTALLAVAVVHAAHLLAVLALYRLGCRLWLGPAGRTTAFVAACLHVLSPAGLFLSAPYAESSCALLSFAGYAAFAAARQRDAAAAAAADGLRLLAGLLFGLATAFRSNGLLNGVVFAYEAAAALADLVRCCRRRRRRRRPLPPLLPLLRPRVRRLAVLGLGGLCVAAGSVLPQAAAYRRFCLAPSGVPGEDRRPWCTALVPSIYAFVQSHYWGTGLFKYWTLSNLPLFLLATPMLLVLARSSLDLGRLAAARDRRGDTEDGEGKGSALLDPRLAPVLQCMAASQLLLAVLAVTSYHVQIITRLASGYPVWYWWLAQGLAAERRAGGAAPAVRRQQRLAGGLVVFVVVYASVQAVLFASFLPPA